MAVVQARATGFVERLHVRAPLDPRAQGPAAGRAVRAGLDRRAGRIPVGAAHGRAPISTALVDGARQRMRLAGMNEEQIRLVECDADAVQPRITLTAPIGGVRGGARWRAKA